MTSMAPGDTRSEEHTSELQSLRHLVCRLLLEKKKIPFVADSQDVVAKNFELLFVGITLQALIIVFFFFNEPPTPELYTLSLHDALPISATDALARLRAHAFSEQRLLIDVAQDVVA